MRRPGGRALPGCRFFPRQRSCGRIVPAARTPPSRAAPTPRDCKTLDQVAPEIGEPWLDHDATYPSLNSTTNPRPSLGKKYWQTEGSFLFQSFCQLTPYVGDITDALPWATLIDDRLANENANAWLWLDFENFWNTGNNYGLTENNNATTVAKRA
jgi:hypothetical protein